MRIGYARVSTDDQTLSLQLDALQEAGSEKNFTDKESGAKADRPGLAHAFEHLRAGDTLVVWRLDRLGRSLSDLLGLVTDLETRGVGFHSLTEQIDTTTPSGKLIFHIFAALAEFERNLIRERTKAGLASARARGRTGGRPKVLPPHRIDVARRMYESKRYTASEICDTLEISRSTLYRYLKERGGTA